VVQLFSQALSLLYPDQNQSCVTAEAELASLSWCQAPILGLDQIFIFVTLSFEEQGGSESLGIDAPDELMLLASNGK
jgi:hypothetical protein